MSARASLVAVGLAMEIAGLGLVSAEDLAPWLINGRDLVLRTGARIAAAIQRSSGLQQPKSVKLALSDHMVMRDHATVMRSIDTEADVATKLDFLLQEATRTQERLNTLERTVEEDQVHVTNALNNLRGDVDEAIVANIETSKLRYLKLRRFGLVLLWIGGACLAIANLV